MHPIRRSKKYRCVLLIYVVDDIYSSMVRPAAPGQYRRDAVVATARRGPRVPIIFIYARVCVCILIYIVVYARAKISALHNPFPFTTLQRHSNNSNMHNIISGRGVCVFIICLLSDVSGGGGGFLAMIFLREIPKDKIYI